MLKSGLFFLDTFSAPHLPSGLVTAMLIGIFVSWKVFFFPRESAGANK
jgi:hypothetical protein